MTLKAMANGNMAYYIIYCVPALWDALGLPRAEHRERARMPSQDTLFETRIGRTISLGANVRF